MWYMALFFMNVKQYCLLFDVHPIVSMILLKIWMLQRQRTKWSIIDKWLSAKCYDIATVFHNSFVMFENRQTSTIRHERRYQQRKYYVQHQHCERIFSSTLVFLYDEHFLSISLEAAPIDEIFSKSFLNTY